MNSVILILTSILSIVYYLKMYIYLMANYYDFIFYTVKLFVYLCIGDNFYFFIKLDLFN
jgi:hypothetical protein